MTKKMRAICGGFMPKTAEDARKAQRDHTDPSIAWVRFEKGEEITPPSALVRDSLKANRFAEEVK